MKNHRYFDGIEWERVANRECEPPFDPPTIQSYEENPRDINEALGYGLDQELDEARVEKLHGELNEIARVELVFN